MQAMNAIPADWTDLGELYWWSTRSASGSPINFPVKTSASLAQDSHLKLE